MRRTIILLMSVLLLSTACQRMAADSPTTVGPKSSAEPVKTNAAPFETREPERYQATIVFSFKTGGSDSNFTEQKTFIARDGAQRRIDFEIAGKTVANLQTADSKQFVLLPKQKVYAEIAASDDNFALTASPDFALAHLLHLKPLEAKFERLGTEEIFGKSAIKYRVDLGAIRETENARTETVVWIDENLGLPLKTEVVSFFKNQPGGATSITELRDLKTEPDAQNFVLPADYRKIALPELQKLLR